MRGRLAAIGLFCALLVPATLSAQTADNVLLVINDASPQSVQVGEYYARKRALSQDHIVHVTTATTDAIQRPEYERTIEAPLNAYLTRNSLQDKILYIVLTKGIPLRVAGTPGVTGTTASVDSELTVLYRRLLGIGAPTAGRIDNPYYLGNQPLSEAKPFTRFLGDIYLVTRLDGFTVNDVIKLIDRGSAPASTGSIVLDEKATLIDRGGDQWLEQAADRLRASGAGSRVALESTKAVASATGPVIGYYSWGSNDPANHLRRFGFTFSPGAIGAMFVSTDGRTFSEPPAEWIPSDPSGTGPRFGGSFQSLAGDLIRDGITGVAAHVAEPLLDATIRPQVLFPAYLAGFTLAESFYLAMPFLSWQTVVIGDPLCTPFPRQELKPDQLARDVDTDTQLPGLFAERRMALIGASGLNLNQEAVKLSLRGDVESSRGNSTAAEALWIRATDLEPKLTLVQLRLASLYEQREAYTQAIDRYRKVVALNPQSAIALNNLAYALAVRTNTPNEALPLAQRAFALAPSAVIADTLGWIQYLLGDNAEAGPLLEQAAAGAPDNAEILFHVASFHEARGDKARARVELDKAAKADPHFTERSDFKALRERLKGSV